MAVILDGTNYVDLSAHGAALDIRTRPMALYAEVETTTDDGDIRGICTHGPQGEPAPPEFSLYLNDSALGGRWESTGGGHEEEDSGYDDGNLHRMCLVVSDSGDEILLVIDGSVVQSASLGGDDTTEDFSNDTYIGTQPDTAAFIGEISNVGVWDAELSQSNAEDLTDGTIDPGDLPTGLLGWWPLDFDARDISGNDRHGTPVGDPDFTEEPPAETVEATISQSVVIGQSVTAAQRVQASAAQTVTIGQSVSTTATVTAQAAQSVVVSQQVSAAASADAAIAQGVVVSQSLTADAAVTAAVAQSVTISQAVAVDVSADAVSVSIAQGVIVTQAMSAAVDVLINLDFVALAPVFRSRIATAPEFRQRVAMSPELGHGDAGDPEFPDREAGDLVFAHGQATTPETRKRTALAPVFAHGDAGEPTF